MIKEKLLEKYGFEKTHSAYVKKGYELRFPMVGKMKLGELEDYLKEFHNEDSKTT